ncbi:MAG TPA: TonB-dependent receptor [candidate division WOR-3 bacterium]|uniref:TonB-dependent receptor n=1 Tax=candidate division WOR-3 bacterium TaxID=2052148 RepID=A0A7C0ZJB7_UNCW3|nr:TonB-dependent receptor [candidate division WOR-3 bacterium]
MFFVLFSFLVKFNVDCFGNPVPQGGFVVLDTLKVPLNEKGSAELQLEQGNYSFTLALPGYRVLKGRIGVMGDTTITLSPEPMSYYIPGIVVIADRYKKNVSDVSASVGFVSRADIALSGAFTTPGALELVPGVSIQRTGLYGRSDIIIRGIGTNGRRLGVYVDGRPEKMTLFDCSITHALPLHNVDRIEIVKGPFASLYGSEAEGGVVNIITRIPNTGIHIRGGSYNTGEIEVSGRLELQPHTIWATVKGMRSDGHLEHSKFSGEDYQGGFTGSILNWYLKGSYKYFSGWKQEPLAVGDTGMPSSEQVYRRGSFDLEIRRNIPSGEIKIKGFRTFGHHIFSDGWESRDRTSGLFLDYTVLGIKNLVGVAGIHYRDGYGERIGTPGAEFWKSDFSPFVHGSFEYGFLIVTGGGRYTISIVCGNGSSVEYKMHGYDGGIVLKTLLGKFRARYDKGFKIPSISETFLFSSGNPSLKPENIKNIEAGWSYNLRGRFYVDLSVFNTYTENFIRTVPTGSMPPFRFENADTLNEKGVEAMVRIVPLNGFDVSVGYIALDRGTKTLGVPLNTWNFKAIYTHSNITAMLDGRWVYNYFSGDNFTLPRNDYIVVNIGARMNLFKKGYVQVNIENILDTDYSIYVVDIPGSSGFYRMPGRSFYLSTGYEL